MCEKKLMSGDIASCTQFLYAIHCSLLYISEVKRLILLSSKIKIQFIVIDENVTYIIVVYT